MFPPQTFDGRSSPAVIAHILRGPGSQRERQDARHDERHVVKRREAGAHVQNGREPEVRLERAPNGTAGQVLSASQFQGCLERERSLADRGTRRFSLLVLRRRDGERGKRAARAALAELAREASQHLRATDLVGRPDEDRIEILLTDTEPDGAQVVAAWMQLAETRLGLQLERTIFVYPVAEASTERDEDDDFPGPDPGSKGHANGRTLQHGERASAHATLAELAPRTSTVESLALAEPWPQADLWPRLHAPTPSWKRALDILVSAVALLLLSPLFALVALAIRLDSAGPAIFRQQRAGRGARPFVFYKFRSMIVDAERGRAALAARNEQSGPIFKIHDDPRVTRVGRWLRRSSIDELPQLWNVLKGDISLVGPRSPTFDEVEKYERWQRRRLSVIGGITCIWQVSGRSQIPFRDWMRLDMRYVACRNLWFDLRLLVLTLPAVVSGRGAC